MKSEWRTVRLGDIARLRAGSVFKLENQGNVRGELPFIKVSDLNLPGNEHAIHDANNWISYGTAAESKIAPHPKGATVFAKIGIALTYNRRRLLIRDTAIDNNMMSAAPDERVVDARYFYFLTKALDFNEIAHGSALPYLNAGDIKAIEIGLPPLAEQEEIRDVLGALEDRIDNLRAANTTLEAIAQTLFKSWFVDFDPVHAKAEGRAPAGMDAATAALFPSEFEDSELGLIPMGWRVRPLDSIATYLNGLALQRFPAESENEFLPVIKIAQLHAGNTMGSDRASAHLKPKYVVHDGDVLFSWSGSLEVEFWCGGDGALNQHLFKVASDEMPKWFYYLATRLHLPEFRRVAANKATTMGHIQRKHLTQAKVTVPPPGVLAAATKIIEPLLDRRITNSLQMRELAQLRDTLLPRLISGKLRLPEAMEAADTALA